MSRCRLLVVVVLALGLGCNIDDGTMLEILFAPDPGANCTISSSTNAALSSGFYDPKPFVFQPNPLLNAIVYGSQPYLQTLMLTNHLQDVTKDPLKTFNDRNVKIETNSILLMGFDVCWYRSDWYGDGTEVSEYKSHKDGLAVACDKVADDQRRFVPATDVIPPNEVRAPAFVYVFTAEDLKAPGMYGSDFAPENIDRLDATDPNRGSEWGTFPAGFDWSTILLNFRAVGKVQSGGTVHSNWFLFPVQIWPDGVSGLCGLVWIPGGCDDGSDQYKGTIAVQEGCALTQFDYKCEDFDSCKD